MKKLFHVSCTSCGEVLFRHSEHYTTIMNYMALCALRTETTLLCFTLMSNHIHLCIETTDPKVFIKSFKISLTKLLNHRYHRSGKLLKPTFHTIELAGANHILTAIAYILRNPVHHNVTETPFSYEYSSANYYFQNELRHKNHYQLVTDTSAIHKLLTKNVNLPKGLNLDSSGLIIPESYLDISRVENIFLTPRTYLYRMNCLSSEEWKEEQAKDPVSAKPIQLTDIETGTGFSIENVLQREKRRFKPRAITDLDLCLLIDKEIPERFHKVSYTCLTQKEKQSYGNYLYINYPASKKQIIRCLGL